MNELRPELSIVVPVYKEEKNVPEFVKRIKPIVESCSRSHEIIFCLDPSPDRTQEVILELRASDPAIKLLAFSRRFGQPMATLGGLSYSRGEAVIVMDVDMQDPPELVTEMVALWKKGCDVVLAQRKTRTGEPWIKTVIANVGYKIINKIADVKIPPNTGDFRLMNRRVVEELNRLKECHGFLRGMVAVVGFKQTVVQFDRPARFSGETNYNRFFGSLRIGFNGVFCFSTYALSLSTMAGFMVAGIGFIIATTYLILKLSGVHYSDGYVTMVILILVMGGIQLVSIGVLGEYIGRIYDEVKQRPKFIVDRAEGFENR